MKDAPHPEKQSPEPESLEGRMKRDLEAWNAAKAIIERISASSRR